MNLKDVFIKQGGVNLLKQYFRNGVLGTAICQFLVLGKSRTALELLRLSVQLKIKQQLEKEYESTLDNFEKKFDESISHSISNKVWICWFQGLENAPEIVKKCYESVKKQLTDRDVVLITKKNMSNYVTFPSFIIDKWKRGIITNTHLTDLLRLELLIRYGGLWLDATVYCSSHRNNIPDYFFSSDLFFFQSLKPGRDGKSSYISSWLISAKTNNKILMATRELCYKYWEKKNLMKDYFLFHYFFSIALNKYEDDWKKVVPRDNSTPHILLLKLFDKYDEKMFLNIICEVPFHKLSYKFTEDQTKIEGTYYKMLT